MKSFKEFCQKVASVLEVIIGLALIVCLFGGGLGFIGYVVAFCVGGETAVAICTWIYKEFYGCIIKISTITTVACFLLIYLKGEAKWINPVKYWLKKDKTSK